MIYVILGMHKSGTTLISRILHHSGINMGDFDDAVSYDEGNQYERNKTQRINLDILGCGDAHSLDVVDPVRSISEGSSAPGQIHELVTGLNEKYKNWGFKDPRTCLTYPIWKKHLPEHKVIYVIRDPLELWHHYRKYIPNRKIVQRTIHGWKALRAWYIYNRMLFSYIRSEVRPHIIQFREFMKTNQSLTKLGEYVNCGLTDCRNKSLYRSKPKYDFAYKVCLVILKKIFASDLEQLFVEIDSIRTAELSPGKSLRINCPDENIVC